MSRAQRIVADLVDALLAFGEHNHDCLARNWKADHVYCNCGLKREFTAAREFLKEQHDDE